MQRAVLEGNGLLPPYKPDAGDGGLILGLESQTVLQGQIFQIKHALADEMLPLHAEGLLVGTVAAHKARIRTFVKHSIGQRVQKRLLETKLIGQPTLKTHTFGYVAKRPDTPITTAVIP